MLVCAECFGDAVLQKLVDELVARSDDGECERHEGRAGVEIAAVAEIVDDVFRSNYTWGHYDNRTDDLFGDELIYIVAEMTGIEQDEVAEALVEALVEGDNYWPADGEEGFYREEKTFVRTQEGFEGHNRLWHEFRKSIVHGQRFFNDEARSLLGELFADLHLQMDEALESPIRLIRPGDPQSKFHRVRIANDAGERERFVKDVPLHLGPPPARKRRAGRINPSGVGAFYAGYDIDTCIAELRPPVGTIVASAEFEILQPLVVLDTTRFAKPVKEPNMFAAHHSARMAQWRFMQRFMSEIAQPVSPDDEHLDYVPTQAVADYLFNHHMFQLNGVEVKIEAIMHRSAQNGEGVNIALLGDAGVVEQKAPSKAERKPELGGPFEYLLSSLPRHPSPAGRLRVVANSYREFRVKSALFGKDGFYDNLDEDYR